jgi:hypothetical protein
MMAVRGLGGGLARAVEQIARADHGAEAGGHGDDPPLPARSMCGTTARAIMIGAVAFTARKRLH